jgi:hypothetical protein
MCATKFPATAGQRRAFTGGALASLPSLSTALNWRKTYALILFGLVTSLCARKTLGQFAGQATSAADTQELQTKIAQDPELNKYPHLQQFADRVVPHRQPSLREADRSLATLLEDAHQIDAPNVNPDQPYLRLNSTEVSAFFAACVADKLTMLRAIGLIARVVNWSNMVLVIDGRDIDAAVKAQTLNVGLSLPMEHAALFAYIPHLGSQPPFLCRFFAVYDRPFTYSYGKDVLTESIAIGAEGGPRLSPRKVFEDRPPSGSLYLVESDILYRGTTVGVYHIKGVTVPGWKAVAFGPVDAMFVEGDTLTIKGTHWLQRNVSHFERPEEWSRLGIHPDPPR